MRNSSKLSKFETIFTIAIIVIFLVISFNSEGCKRKFKSFTSEQTGGLNRTLTVYDYNGKPIKSWTGKFDISEGTKEVYFDINGKRVIIHGGIVITEEK